MLCNGKRRHVTASLNAALKASRESIETRGRLLWADAVSIDQCNESEKSEQIPLMRRIYSEADACFVHLGEGEALVTQGLDLMLRLRLLQDHLSNPEKRGSIPTNALFTLLPSRGHTCRREYLRIFTSPWFGRTWILQEITLSKKALLGIGRYVVTWDCMQDSYDFLAIHNLLWRLWPYPEGAVQHLVNFASIQDIRKISQWSDLVSALIVILKITKEYKVTDPRDKIFGILGLISDVPDGLKTIVDYKLSVGEVFHRAAVYMYKHPDSVFCLKQAGLQRQTGQWEMPSWVPDWKPEQLAAGGRIRFQAESAASSPHEILSLTLYHSRITQASNLYANRKSPTDPRYLGSEAFYAWLDSVRLV